MSKLRHTVPTTTSDPPAPTNGTAYLMILNAIETRSGLIQGKLEAAGEYCAIGSFFHVNKGVPLSEALIDEVAMVNDSMPLATPKQRKMRVRQWLRWKLSQCGMPGYASAKPSDAVATKAKK